MRRSLYTVSRVRNDGIPYGLVHGSMDGEESLCGIVFDSGDWYILTNCFDGETTCPKCKTAPLVPLQGDKHGPKNQTDSSMA